MPRNARMHLEDMVEAAEKVTAYAGDMTFDAFCADSKTRDAVIRNLEVIGEAAKNVTPDIRERFFDIEWKKIAGLRDMLIHEYFGVDVEIVWDIVQNKIPPLTKQLRTILSQGV